MIYDQRINSVWKKNLNRIFKKTPNSTNNQIIFESLNTGKILELNECLFDDLLPFSLVSSPISSINTIDNVWIASSMLARVSDTTNNLVVLEGEFPVGIIGGKEILKGIIKNPTPYFFHDILSREIMNPDFYLDTRIAKLGTLFKQMQQAKRLFAIIQNSTQSFSAFSVREILEIGALCKTDINASELPERKIRFFKREETIADIIKSLLQEDTDLLILENELLFIDQTTIIEKIVGDLNYLQDVDNFLDLNASTFKLENPKLIPDKLTLSEICKTMLCMKHPYVMTSNRIWTPRDVLYVLIKGLWN